MLFMRPSDEETLLLRYLPDIINQSQECWSCVCDLHTYKTLRVCVYIQRGPCLPLLYLHVIFHHCSNCMFVFDCFWMFQHKLYLSIYLVFLSMLSKLKRTQCLILLLGKYLITVCTSVCERGEVFRIAHQVWWARTMTLLYVIEKPTDNSCIAVARSFYRWPLRSSTRPNWMLSTWRRSTGKFRSWRCWTTPTSSSSTRWVFSLSACYLLKNFWLPNMQDMKTNL